MDSAPAPRDGAPHNPHALNGLARSRSASPDRDIANALSNNPQRTPPIDAKQKGRFAERSGSAASGARRPGLWASTPRSKRASSSLSFLSHFPQRATERDAALH